MGTCTCDKLYESSKLIHDTGFQIDDLLGMYYFLSGHKKTLTNQ